jgi:hypothetical protein
LSFVVGFAKKTGVQSPTIFRKNLPVFTIQHTGWHTLPPGKALFAAGLTPALPQRRLTRQQLDDPATQEQIFYRHWR